MSPTLFSRRRVLALAAAGVVTLAACGSDGAGDDADVTPATDPTLPPATDPPTTGDPDAGDASVLPAAGSVVEFGYYGGFTTQEFSFQRPPAILLTADGRLIEAAAVPEIFPGPLLPQHTVSSITEAGITQLIEFLDGEGLLQAADYEVDSLVADASTATLVITLADGEVRHEAYALGIGGFEDATETPDRQRLADALARLGDVRSIVEPGEIGEPEPWLPDAFQVVALPAGDLTGLDLDPRLLPWPADAGVSLADAGECVEISRDQIGSLLDEADQLTFFTDGDQTFQLLARPAYPGRTC